MKKLSKRDQKQYQAMMEFSEIHDDLGDGAFFALAEDLHGWTVDDWAWLNEVNENISQ